MPNERRALFQISALLSSKIGIFQVLFDDSPFGRQYPMRTIGAKMLIQKQPFMIPHHGKSQELCRTCQASLSTTVRKQVDLWAFLRHLKNREAHILWWSHPLVCVLQISLGRSHTSSRGLVKAKKLISNDVVEPYASFRQKTLW